MRGDDGSYEYGYDSGDGISAYQKASADNQVEGFYAFPDANGKIVKVKYTAGIQGYLPESSNLNKVVQLPNENFNHQSSSTVHPVPVTSSNFISRNDGSVKIENLGKSSPGSALNLNSNRQSSPFHVSTGSEVQQSPNKNDYNTAKFVHPTFTIITPSMDQKSFEYGPKNAIVLGYLSPQHSERYGYIYDTQN